MQQRRPRTIRQVAEITGLPQHLIRYHIERGYIPIRHQPHKVHYYSDAEMHLYSASRASPTRTGSRLLLWGQGTLNSVNYPPPRSGAAPGSAPLASRPTTCCLK